MRFKVDENLPTEIVELLRKEGHDACTVPEQRMGGQVDQCVAAACQAERRALVTLDLDFSDVRAYPPGDYAGIIVLRPTRQSIPRVVRLVERALALLRTETLEAHLWVVDEGRVRIRGEEPRDAP